MLVDGLETEAREAGQKRLELLKDGPPPTRARNGNFNLNKEQIIEQAVQCFELRLAGASIAQISKTLKVSADLVLKRLRQHEVAYLLPAAESVRKMEIARYDMYLLRLQSAIASGDVAAINTAIRVSVERRRLLGVDAPVEVNNRYPDGVPTVLDSKISQLLDEMEENASKDAADNNC